LDDKEKAWRSQHKAVRRPEGRASEFFLKIVRSDAFRRMMFGARATVRVEVIWSIQKFYA